MRLLRRIKNSSQWADVIGDPLWNIEGECPPSALWQLYEARYPSGDLSVWRVKSDDDVENVAAADALQRGTDNKLELQDIGYVEIAEDYLSVGNYNLVNKAATTPLSDINQKHVNIEAVTGRKFIEFARLIRMHGAHRVVTKRQIASRIADRLASGELVLSSFKAKKKEHTAGVLYAVWSMGSISFQKPGTE